MVKLPYEQSDIDCLYWKMVRVGQIAGGGRKKLKVRELAKVSLKGCCGKVKKIRVSKQMLKIYVSCFISLVRTNILVDRFGTSVGNDQREGYLLPT